MTHSLLKLGNYYTFCWIIITNLKTGRFETRRFETWRFVNLTLCESDVLKPDVLKPDVVKPDVLKPDVLWMYLVDGYSEHLHMSPRHGCPCACVTCMNIHEHTWTALVCRRNSTYKAVACCLADSLQVPCVSNHIWVTTKERLDQSHLYPNLEVPGLTCPGREMPRVGSEHSRKEPSRQLVDGY